MSELFTFIGMINHSHDFIIGGHVVLVGLIVLVMARMATSNMKVVPSGMQNIMEAYLLGVLSIGKDSMGEEKARKYLPLVATIGLLVLVSNLIGIIPGFEAPTSNVNFTIVLAISVFLYYNFQGIKENGVIKYFAHFMGPKLVLAPLMFPIEIVSHFSRIVSLSFRLFGNIKGDDLFLMVLLMLAPWVAPLTAFTLLTLMAFLQTFIFMVLTYVYLAGAVMISEEH